MLVDSVTVAKKHFSKRSLRAESHLVNEPTSGFVHSYAEVDTHIRFAASLLFMSHYRNKLHTTASASEQILEA